MPEAIIIVGSKRRRHEESVSARWTVETNEKVNGLATLELLGQSVLQRMVEELRKAKVDEITVFVDEPLSSDISAGATNTAWEAASEQLVKFGKKGVDSILIAELGAYVELDFAELFRVHQESDKGITRAFHQNSPLSFWVVNPTMLPESQEVRGVLHRGDSAEFHASGYINGLETAADLRRLVNDGLGCRCQFRPQGLEVKPGIWMAPGAQVERAARIVAPAYIGRNVKIGDECLITRGSNVESNSQVDYGTAIEDSSILSNTYVGIGLDLSHSIAHGNSLLNLQHDVLLQISDRAVMRQNKQPSARDRYLALDLGIGEPVVTSVGHD